MTVAAVPTTAELKATITEINKKVDEWRLADEPVVRWRKGQRKAISEELAKMFHELFTATESSEFDEEAKPIVLAIDDFEKLQTEWAEAITYEPEDTDPSGTSAMWLAWDAVVKSLTPHKFPEPESIKALVAQNVGDQQIALIYGFFKADGSLDIQKAREERETPGTHFDRSKWVHPTQKRMNAEVATKWSARARQSRPDFGSFEPQIAPESIEELINQRVGSKQIAEMKQITVEEVRAKAAEMGVPLDGQIVAPVSPADRMADVRKADAELDAKLTEIAKEEAIDAFEKLSLQEQVKALKDEGAETPEALLEVLKEFHPKLTIAGVKSALKKLG